MSGIAPGGDGAWVEFCHLDPSSTATDPLEIQDWLAKHGIVFRNRDGPAGDTVFFVAPTDHARAVELWAEQRGSAEWILARLAPPPDRGPTGRGARPDPTRGT